MTDAHEIYAKFVDELRYVDDVVQIILKGHLVMEDVMTDAICTFVHHGSQIEDARLQFHQKLKICRSMSLSDQENRMWDMIAAINTLRNQLSHSLDSEQRQARFTSLSSHFSREFPHLKDKVYDEMSPEASICLMAISTSLGYLREFNAEVHRFRTLVNAHDQALNEGKLNST